MVFLKQVLHAAFFTTVLLAIAGSSRAAEFAAPYVPTAQSVVDRMLEIAKVTPDDHVIDLGCGDGRIVISAAKKYGASGFGVDIDAKLVALANANARAAGVSDRARFYKRDLFATDLSKASVVTIYLLTRSVIKLQSRLFDLKPGTRIVSHAGSMGEWRADQFQMFDVNDKVRPDAPTKTYIYLWVVPSRVAGQWRWSMPVGARTLDYELMVSQKYQNFSGTLRVNGKEVSISPGKLDGDRIALDFRAEVDGNLLQHRLVGQVSGQSITGTATVAGERVQSEAEWKAFRMATEKAHPILLEPVMQVRVQAPQEFSGDLLGDLNSRRGRIQGLDSHGAIQIISAEVPMVEMLTYPQTLDSITSARGTYHMEFSRYDELPEHLARKVIQKAIEEGRIRKDEE